MVTIYHNRLIEIIDWNSPLNRYDKLYRLIR